MSDITLNLTKRSYWQAVPGHRRRCLIAQELKTTYGGSWDVTYAGGIRGSGLTWSRRWKLSPGAMATMKKFDTGGKIRSYGPLGDVFLGMRREKPPARSVLGPVTLTGKPLPTLAERAAARKRPKPLRAAKTARKPQVKAAPPAKKARQPVARRGRLI